MLVGVVSSYSISMYSFNFETEMARATAYFFLITRHFNISSILTEQLHFSQTIVVEMFAFKFINKKHSCLHLTANLKLQISDCASAIWNLCTVEPSSVRQACCR